MIFDMHFENIVICKHSNLTPPPPWLPWTAPLYNFWSIKSKVGMTKNEAAILKWYNFLK